ncbi:MAG: bifunctional DNA-formamidopyrimidine glycosylase/DNA-(apurinic or apyrimidinic site) lyase [Planctomycetes bacterium]|nr:bifunctional DNA-formamidopyrimidine glycosylase/DNA-(apurinic or apyrimidinic site) lyase [Planctomycetota bacterium]
MPELPEVERVRRSLAERVVGRRVERVMLRRADIVEGDRSPAALLAGRVITGIERHGKQMAIVTDTGRCICVHLGMTGSLCYEPATRGEKGEGKKHVHVVWTLDAGDRFEFRDPRRFGGVWTFPDRDTLVRDRWSLLGRDALAIEAGELHAALGDSRRPIKAALLDQAVVAGLGNIYVDELLFTCGVHPLTPARRVSAAVVEAMTRAMRALLARSIEAGGTTLRDYVDANGQAGGFQSQHQVYGRRGEGCRVCGIALRSRVLAGRMTVWCPTCQPGGRKR